MNDVSVVRIVDRPLGPAEPHRVTVSTTVPGFAPRTATVDVGFPVDAVAAEKLRWYLEDYAGFPTEPGPAMAAESERLQERLGRDLFRAVFAGDDAREVWAQAKLGGLDRLRIEVDADPADVPGLPWELLREPNGPPLVVAAGQFVRTHHQAALTRLPTEGHDRLRVLLVICRPAGRVDVPFRSVASRLVRSGMDQLDGLDLDVLRPATFAHLAATLHATKDAGRPYHVVHFDGHGTYLDVGEAGEGGVAVSATRYGPSLAAPARTGPHGYLLFEKPGSSTNQELVDGPTLADLLVATRVPVLVLNACRSAYAEAPPGPDPSLTEVHDRVRAYGSLAAEIADRGVAGVVAMRYNVYVVTAAQFVADLYTHLLAGRTLGEAAAAGRRTLAADPARALGAGPVDLQDWSVPTVYEAAPRTLVDRPTEPARITLRGDDARAGNSDVPRPPDIGFFGRDEALLALDRAFDADQIVLLHALAGAGKTTTAAEFTRWYLATGGLRHQQGHEQGQGVVLWTSFERHMPLERVLDKAGAVFAPLLEGGGIHWPTITDHTERRTLILQVLALVPVLWIWDNVEPVTGFPTGTESAWTADEQTELRDFLRALRVETRAKVLLTSRRDEHPWLGELPRRVALAPMPMRESLQLIRALVRRLDRPTDSIDWRGLARFCGGNPLTITVTVRQAVLREHVATVEQVDTFVARVQAGHTPLEPNEDSEQGRSASLAASLAYGFHHAFTAAEQARLALLHLFRDVVDAGALHFMDHPGITEETVEAAVTGRQALIPLLDRAAELGLLTACGGGFYRIHPALPWFFTDLFTLHVPDPAVAERAFTLACATTSDCLQTLIACGQNHEIFPALRAEEANLRHALQLGRAHGLRDAVLRCTDSLAHLYDLTGRGAEWARIVETIEGDYLDPTSGLPRPGLDEHYSTVVGYRVVVARARWDLPTAVRWQTALCSWTESRAARYRDATPDELDQDGRHHLRTHARSEYVLGTLLREQEDPACRPHLLTAYLLAGRIGEQSTQAGSASGLGTAHLHVPALRDLDQAQYWHQRELDLTPEQDRLGRAATHSALADIAIERILDTDPIDRHSEQVKAYLHQAEAGHGRALELLPEDHHERRGASHGQLGRAFAMTRNGQRALHHYQQSLYHDETRGDMKRAGLTRLNIAVVHREHGRSREAMLYARAALANFRQVGPGAAARTEQARSFLQQLELPGS